MLNENGSAAEKVEPKIRKRRRRFRKKRPNERCYNLNELWGALQVMKEAWKLFKEFSADTSMHGIKYMTEDNRPWPERVYWGIAIILCIKFASSYSYSLYQKWDLDTDDFRFSEKYMNVWQIPFGAVTFCPVGGPSPSNEHFRSNESLRNGTIRSMTNDVSETIKNVVWRGKRVGATKYFTEIATEEGFCFTFNMMRFDDIFKANTTFQAFDNLKNNKIRNSSWSLKEGYLMNKTNYNDYPFRVLGSGETGGLKFEIWQNISDIYKSTSGVHGFKLVVHSPSEVPQFDKHYLRFSLEKAASVIVRPTLIFTEELETYSRQLQQCEYENERELRYFKRYTMANCQLECLVNVTIEKCGCVPFSLPGSNDTKICDDTEVSLYCYTDAKRKLMIDTMAQSLESSKKIDDRGNPKCKCSPSCTSLRYNAKISYDDNRYFANRGSARKIFRTSVSIYFDWDDVTYYKPIGDVKSWTAKFADLVTNFCGLWGMFIGISTITIVEIAYYLVIRQVDDDDEYFYDD